MDFFDSVFSIASMLFRDCKIRYSGRVEVILNVNVSREMSQVIVRRWGKDEQNMAGLCNKEPWVGVLFNKESLVVVLCNKSQHPTNVQQGGAAHSKGLTFPRYKSLYVRIAYAPRYFSLCLPHSFARRLSIVVTLCPVRRLNSKLVKWIGKQRGDLEQSKNSDKRSQP